jgi:hypothetical protein
MIHCTACGGLVTAQVVTKKSGKTYTYYFCQNLKRTCRKVGLREEILERQIDELLAQMTILPAFSRWGENALEDWRQVVWRGVLSTTRQNFPVQPGNISRTGSTPFRVISRLTSPKGWDNAS